MSIFFIAYQAIYSHTLTIDDTIYKSDEVFVETLSSNNIRELSRVTSTAIILEKVTLISINDVLAIPEGDFGVATLNFTISISQSDLLNPITVDYTISGGNEEGTTGTLTFAAATDILSQTVSVTTNGDRLIEPDEVIKVTLINASANSVLSATDNEGISSFTNDDTCAAGTTPPILNGDPTSFCDTNSVNLNNFVVGGSSGAPIFSTLRWSLLSSPTSEADFIPSSIVTTANVYYAVFWDALSECASLSSSVNIVFNTSPNIDQDATTTACNNSDDRFGVTSVDLDNFSIGSAAGEWVVVNSNPEVTTISSDNVVDFANTFAGLYLYTYTTNTATGACADQSFTVTVEVIDCDFCVSGDQAPSLNSSTPLVFCDTVNVSLNDYTNDTPPVGTTLEWATVANPESTTAIFLKPAQIANPNPGTVYGFFWDDLNKCASPTLPITIVLNDTPVINETTGSEICGLGSTELTVAGSTPNTVQPPTYNWYATNNPADTDILDSGAVFLTPVISTTTTYYVEATANNCISARVPVVATVSTIQSAGIPTNKSSCSNVENGPTAIDLDDSLTGESTGTWSITQDPSGSLTIDESNIVNFVNKPDGSYVFTFTTTMAQAPCVNESSEVTIVVNDCDVDTDLDGLFDGSEALLNTNPNSSDTDNDLINDADEVGADINNPIDTDDDRIIDALESNILDQDNDGIVNHLDPANDNPCLPNRYNDACDTDGDGLSDLDEQTNGSNEDDSCSPTATPDCDIPIDLEVLKTVDKENVEVGEQVVFSITVNNLSNRVVKSVIIGELLQSGFQYINHNASLGTYNLETGNWDVNELQALDSMVLEIIVETLDNGDYANTAELLQSFPNDGNSENNTATIDISIIQGVDLIIENTVDNQFPSIGNQVNFTITLTNLTSSKITNVEINNLIKDTSGFSYVSNETSSGTYNENNGIWRLTEIEPDQVNTLKITVEVLKSGSYINTATITSSLPKDINEENNEAKVLLSPVDTDCVVVYNIFSQNQNLANDYLEIGCIDNFANNSLKVYNRYGNQVYEAKPYRDKTWKGTGNDGDLPLGTYFYILDLGDGNGVRKGWIQIIR